MNLEKERERFEGRGVDYDFTKDESGDYLDPQTEIAWYSWRAAKSEAQADVRELTRILSVCLMCGDLTPGLREDVRAALAKHKGAHGV